MASHGESQDTGATSLKTCNYSHVVDVIRVYDSLVYVAGKLAWVSSLGFEGKEVGNINGRKASVLRVDLNDSPALVVIWDENTDGMVQENTHYKISYLTPLKSAAPLDSVQTYETTYKTIVSKLSNMEDCSRARRCWKIKNLVDFTKVVTSFEEVDLVGRIESISDDNLKLTDGEGHFISIYFPSGVKDTGLQRQERIGMCVGVMNLEIHRGASSDERKYQFGVRSVVIWEPKNKSNHLLEPLELLKFVGMDFNSLSGFTGESNFDPGEQDDGGPRNIAAQPTKHTELTSLMTSKVANPSNGSSTSLYDADAPLFHTLPPHPSPTVIPCSDDESENVSGKRAGTTGDVHGALKRARHFEVQADHGPVSSRSRSAVELGVGSKLLNFFTSFGVPVIGLKLFAESGNDELVSKSQACVTFNPDQSLGVIAASTIEGPSEDHLPQIRSFYMKLILEFLSGLGFQSTVTTTPTIVWFWINFGTDENRKAAKLEHHSFGNQCEFKIFFFVDIYNCIERKQVVKSMFLSPNVAILCSGIGADNACVCKRISNDDGIAPRQLVAPENTPVDCPVLLECSGNLDDQSKVTVFLDGYPQRNAYIGPRDVTGIDVLKELRFYDSLLPATECNAYLYCVNCIYKNLDPIARYKVMSYGIAELIVRRKCCSAVCNENHQLHLLPFKLQQ